MTTLADGVERAAEDLRSEEKPWQRAAARGNLLPAVDECARRMKEAERDADAARYEHQVFVERMFMRPMSGAERDEYLAEIVALEDAIVGYEREQARWSVLLERLKAL